MADINNHTFVVANEKPTINYLVTYTKSRVNNTTMKYDFTLTCSLSAASWFNSGLALMCTMTINGVSASVRIKANDNDNWDGREGKTTRIKYVSVQCTEAVGNVAQTVRFKVVSDGRISTVVGVIDDSQYTVLSSALSISACAVPTALSCSPTVTANTTLSVSWSGASGGTNNAITGYEFQYSDSANNSSWGAWTAAGSFSTSSGSGSTTLSAPAGGYYRRFRIRTLGGAGSAYYSGWKESSNNVLKNVPPSTPASVTASPNLYTNPQISVVWSGTVKGSSAIAKYQIYREAYTGAAGTNTLIATITSSATSGTYTDNVTGFDGANIRYRIITVDALNASSDSAYSNYVKKASAAIAPALEAPYSNNAMMYNRRPRFLVEVKAHPDGSAQKLIVSVSGKYSYDSELDPERFSTGGYYVGAKKIVFLSPFLDYGSYVLTVATVDGNGSQSPLTTRNFRIGAMGVPEIYSNISAVKAWHLGNLHTYLDYVCAFYNVPKSKWTDIVAGKTEIWYFPRHVKEVRDALSAVRSKINAWDATSYLDINPFVWVDIGFLRPRADVVLQLYLVVGAWISHRNTCGDLAGIPYYKLSNYTYLGLEEEEVF